MTEGDKNSLCLERTVFDQLMPMHLLLDSAGQIIHAGPTLSRIAEGSPLIGVGFFEAFELRRPYNVTTMEGLVAATGGRLSLRLRADPRAALKGLAVPVAAGSGLLINLSFGISAVEAVGTYRLTSADFPPTDLTVEMLYLVEAKEAVLGESRNLNRRLQGARIAAEEQAFTDTLTGLKNRRAMDHILSRYTEADLPFSLIHLDLDWFKEVNDTYGHAAGDHVLQEVARILVSVTRTEDTVVRLGGDEFVLIVPKLLCRERLQGIADRILRQLEDPIPFGAANCRVSASIGIVTSDSYDATDTDRMLHDADRALYRSKHAGRSQLSFASDMPPDARGSAALS